MITEATNIEYNQFYQEWETINAFLKADRDVLKQMLDKGTYEDTDRLAYRQNNFDFKPLTSNAISRLTGMLYLNDQDIEREHGFDENLFTQIGMFSEDYEIILMNIAKNILAFGSATIVIKPGPMIAVYNPLSTPRWNDSELVLVTKQSKTTSLKEDEVMFNVWTHYTPDGFEKYRKEDTNSAEPNEVLIDRFEYPITFQNGNGAPMNPAFRTHIDWAQSLGQQLVRQHQSIFTLRSSVDTSIQEALNSGSIQLGVGDDIDQMDEIIDALSKKSKYIPYGQNEHKPISIPTGPIKEAMKNLNKKEESLEKTIGTNLIQRTQGQTATESVINARTGTEAVVKRLALEMASIEEEILKRLMVMEDQTLTGSPELNDVQVTYPELIVSTTNSNRN